MRSILINYTGSVIWVVCSGKKKKSYCPNITKPFVIQLCTEFRSEMNVALMVKTVRLQPSKIQDGNISATGLASAAHEIFSGST